MASSFHEFYNRCGNSFRIYPDILAELGLTPLFDIMIRKAETTNLYTLQVMVRQSLQHGCAKTALQSIFLHRDNPAGPAGSSQNKLHIERFNKPGIDDPGGNSL